MSLKNEIISQTKDHSNITQLLIEEAIHIEAISRIIINAFIKKKKVFTCGNGGSAADSLHLNSEILGRFEKERNGFSSINLASDIATLTAIGNDYGFENIFSRQLEALGSKEDVLVVFSTSGNSENIFKAVTLAKMKGIKVIGLLGNDGGKLREILDHKVIIKSPKTSRIQEMHSLVIHMICTFLDEFEDYQNL